MYTSVRTAGIRLKIGNVDMRFVLIFFSLDFLLFLFLFCTKLKLDTNEGLKHLL